MNGVRLPRRIASSYTTDVRVLSIIVAVEEQVKMVVQVAGMNTLVRPDPRQDERIMWYRQVSLPSVDSHADVQSRSVRD